MVQMLSSVPPGNPKVQILYAKEKNPDKKQAHKLRISMSSQNQQQHLLELLSLPSELSHRYNRQTESNNPMIDKRRSIKKTLNTSR
jgi:hypothetical protein